MYLPPGKLVSRKICIFRPKAGLQNGIPSETCHIPKRGDNHHAEK
jgi:hypothetical protein